MSRNDRDTIPFRRLTISVEEKPSDWLPILEARGYRTGECAAQLLDGLEPEDCPPCIDFALVSVANLGFDNCACLQAIYSRAQERGLQLCPAATGPRLRLQLLDQPQDEWLYIAMAPLYDSDGIPAIFELDRAFDAPWLRGFNAPPRKHFHPRDSFVFSLR